MKDCLPDFFAYGIESDPRPTPVPKGKTARGFNHPYTARMLCPRAYIYDIDNDIKYVFKPRYFNSNLPLQLCGQNHER